VKIAQVDPEFSLLNRLF